jgi:anti-sigma regulatory factor (Ser/Thr protein kinase)
MILRLASASAIEDDPAGIAVAAADLDYRRRLVGIKTPPVETLVERARLSEVQSPAISGSYRAVAGSVGPAREALAEFALRCGANDERVGAVRLAASEALTNAVVHAYEHEPGAVYVTAWLAGEEIWVLVGDDGPGLHPRSNRPGLGLGLGLIAQLSDGFSVVNRSAGGTEVRMRFALDVGEDPDAGHSRGSVISAI